MNDLKVIDLPFFEKTEVHSSVLPVGKVLSSTQELRRRAFDSIVWEDSKTEDTLFLNDSVLTLEKSNATLVLKDKSEMFLSENTLIVLEPIDVKAPDLLRVRFKRGELRTRSAGATTFVSAPLWNLKVEKGGEIKMKSLPDEKIEVELLKGQVQVLGKKGKFSFSNEELLLLNKENVESVPLSQTMSWTNAKDDLLRVYGRSFPEKVTLSWKGHAKSLRLRGSGSDLSEISVEPEQDYVQVMLNPGVYEARLVQNREISPTLKLVVQQAPSLRLVSPHPRDRFPAGSEATFIWRSEKPWPRYTLEFARDLTFTNVVLSHPTEDTKVTVKMPEGGSYYWRVQGVDDLGFFVPSVEFNSIFSVKDPLSAPKLRAPETRAPAKDDSAFNLKKILENIFNLFIPSAHADDLGFEAVFEWDMVEGADFYTVEIDVNPDFKKPILVEKTKDPQFVWTKAPEGDFFWRVAAGADERMGLFSEAAAIHLARPLLGSEEIAPGVQVRRPKQGLESFPEAPVVPILEATPAASVDEPKAEPSRPTHLAIWYGLGYDYTILSGTEKTTALFGGLSPLQIGVDLDIPKGSEATVIFDTKYSRSLWKPKNPVETPFQDQLVDTSIRSHIHYQSKPWSLHYGLGLAYVSTLKRTGLESVKLDPAWLIGPSLGFDWFYSEHWFFTHVVGVHFGQGLTELAAGNRLARKIPLNDQAQLIFGLQMDFGFQRGLEGSNYHYQMGVNVGLEW